MNVFTLKLGKEIRRYELDEDKSSLLSRFGNGGKSPGSKRWICNMFMAIFRESLPEKPPVFKLILAHMGLVFNLLLALAAVVLLAKDGHFFRIVWPVC